MSSEERRPSIVMRRRVTLKSIKRTDTRKKKITKRSTEQNVRISNFGCFPTLLQVNPVTGCEEKPGPSPLEGMSEEQKEYEAMQLVNLMDKMTRTGMIQPCR